MKRYLSKLTGCMRNGSQILLATVVLFVTALATNSHAVAFGDPTGNDWDFLVRGGGQDGILFLHFTKDLDPNNNLPTFEGVFVYAGNLHTPPTSARSTGVGPGRTTGSPISLTNLFGGGFIQGVSGTVADNGGTNDWFPDSTGLRGDWFYNTKGQIVGSYYSVIVIAAGTTNGITNNVSFVGNVVPSKHLTLSASSSFGNFTANGIPLVATTVPVDKFFWTAQRNLRGGLVLDETFSVSPSLIPNMFLLNGAGPSYTYDPASFCLISSQKRIGFAIAQVPTGVTNPIPVTSGTYGTFTGSTKAISARTSGFIATETNRITFDAAAVMVP